MIGFKWLKPKGNVCDGKYTYIELAFNLRGHTEILPIPSDDITVSGNIVDDHPMQAVIDCDTPTVIHI